MRHICVMAALVVAFLLFAGMAANAAPIIGYVVESAGGEAMGVTNPEQRIQKGVDAVLVMIEGTKFEARTNLMGWFWFSDLPDGVYNIAAIKEGYNTVTKQVKVEGRAPASVTIVMNRKKMAPGISGGYGPSEVAIPNAVYVAYAAIAAPGSSTTPGNQMPLPGSNMSTLQFKSALANGANLDNMTGFPAPEIKPPGGPGDFQTPVSYYPNNLTVMDPNTPKDMKFVNLNAKPYWMCFDTSGSKLFVSTDSQYIMVVDVAGGNKVVGSIPTGGIVTDMTRGPDGNVYVSVSSATPGVLVISPQTSTAISYLKVKPVHVPDAQPRALVAGTDMVYVAMAASQAGEVLAVSKAGGATVSSCLVGAYPQGIAMAPNGQFLFVANFNSSDVSVISAANMQHLGKIRVGIQPMRIVCNSRGDRVYVTNNGSNCVTVIDGRNGAVIATVNTGKGPMGIGINSAGSRVFVANNKEGTVTVINAEINAAIQTTTATTSSRPFGIAIRP